jgi:hypothetical protein
MSLINLNHCKDSISPNIHNNIQKVTPNNVSFSARSELVRDIRDVVEISADPVAKALRKIEQKIALLPHEMAYIVDGKTGATLLEKQGDTSKVDFTKSEMRLLKGNILTHNHPEDKNLSEPDIYVATGSEAAEVRATALDKVHSIKIPTGFSFNHVPKDLFNAVKESHLKLTTPNVLKTGGLKVFAPAYNRIRLVRNPNLHHEDFIQTLMDINKGLHAIKYMQEQGIPIDQVADKMGAGLHDAAVKSLCKQLGLTYNCEKL